MSSDLQQQLWEFVFDLLPEDDAKKLREQITSDPDVARAYATVKLQSEAVGRAARYETPVMSWTRDGNGQAAVEKTAALPQHVRSPKSRTSRAANWIISIAAMGLVCLLGSELLWTPALQKTPVMVANASVAAPIQTVVAGPSLVHPEVGAQYNVRTADIHGTPISTPVRYRVFDDTGSVMIEHDEETNSAGNGWFDVPASVVGKAARLEVAPGDESAIAVSQPLQAASDRFATYVRTDKPLYRPGETVLYRSVTLSRFGLRAEQEHAVDFGLIAANGEQVPNSQQAVQTEQGVASGAYVLPDDLSPGQYSLHVTSSEQAFADEWRDFDVQAFTTPRFKKKLDLDRDSYALGDEVKAKLSIEMAEGEPLAEGLVAGQALFDQQIVDIEPGRTDSNGNFDVRLRVPENLESAAANLKVTVTASDGVSETVSKDIPLTLEHVNVEFYPEGGDLVAGVPNRVYFYGRDPLGEPAHIEGRISDSQEQTVATLATEHEGRGRFAFTPAANESYRLVIDKPADVKKEIPLPPAQAEHFLALNTGDGVFDADAPLDVSVATTQPTIPVLVAAYCRGAMIGQMNLKSSDFAAEPAGGYVCSASLPLVGDAQGVIRVSVFDTRESPPLPIAERLVFRRISRQLQVDITSDHESYAPGSEVELKLGIRDEQNAPVAAALGISVVDDAILSLAEDKSTRLPTYFHLLTEVSNPEELEDANFYLSGDPEAARALDLLLGTQGWRKLADVYLGDLVAGGRRKTAEYGYADAWSFGAIANEYYAVPVDNESLVPVLANNTLAIQSLDSHVPVAPITKVSARPVWLAWVLMFGGGVLLLVLAILAVLHVQAAWKVQVPSVAVAACALLVGLWAMPKAEHRSMTVALAPTESAKTSSDSRGYLADELAAEPQRLEPLAEQAEATDMNDYAAPMASETVTGSEFAPMGRAGAAKPADTVPAPKIGSESEGLDRMLDSGMAGRKAEAPQESAPTPPAPAGAAPAAPVPEAAPSPDATPPPPASKLTTKLERRAVDPAELSKSQLGAMQQSLENPIRFQEEKARVRLFRYQRLSEITPAVASGTAYWNPLLPVDASGAATINFRLPASTTSYRAIIEAHGADRLGSSEKLIIAAPPADNK